MMRRLSCLTAAFATGLRPVAQPPTRCQRRMPHLVAVHASLPPSDTDNDEGVSAADEMYMAHAMLQAEHAFAAGEVPIGAVLVRDGAIVSAAHNRVESSHDASAHAEMLCMRSAGADANAWRLNASTLYVTVEPCAMCHAALHAFRVDRLVYGAPNTRMGAIESDMRAIAAVPHPYHQVRVTGGVRADEASMLMRRFFQRRRDEPRYAGPAESPSTD